MPITVPIILLIAIGATLVYAGWTQEFDREQHRFWCAMSFTWVFATAFIYLLLLIDVYALAGKLWLLTDGNAVAIGAGLSYVLATELCVRAWPD